MSYGVIIINILAALLIALILWWFFGGKQTATVSVENTPVVIIVEDGVYQPSLIQFVANKPITLHFLRKDDSACAATVTFPALDLAYDLPKDKIVIVTLPPQKAGTLEFTCRMGMYRGKLVIS